MQENGVDTSLFYKLANALTGFIYSFHMPVFIALSGCLFALKRYDLRSLVSKKFKRLLIPFFVVWLAWNLPIKYFTGYYNNVSVSGMFLQIILPYMCLPVVPRVFVLCFFTGTIHYKI